MKRRVIAIWNKDQHVAEADIDAMASYLNSFIGKRAEDHVEVVQLTTGGWAFVGTAHTEQEYHAMRGEIKHFRQNKPKEEC